MQLVKAEESATCEFWLGPDYDGERCFAPAAYCDIDGPADLSYGPSFFCEEHKPAEVSHQNVTKD